VRHLNSHFSNICQLTCVSTDWETNTKQSNFNYMPSLFVPAYYTTYFKCERPVIHLF